MTRKVRGLTGSASDGRSENATHSNVVIADKYIEPKLFLSYVRRTSAKNNIDVFSVTICGKM